MATKSATWVSKASAVYGKDVLSEFRARYAVNAVVLFAVTTLVAVSPTMSSDQLGAYPRQVFAGEMNAHQELVERVAHMHLDAEKYDQLLQHYYDQRGYDRRGIPTRATLAKLGLSREGEAAARYATLT